MQSSVELTAGFPVKPGMTAILRTAWEKGDSDESLKRKGVFSIPTTRFFSLVQNEFLSDYRLV
jgi:hypothetical protein